MKIKVNRYRVWGGTGKRAAWYQSVEKTQSDFERWTDKPTLLESLI